eukprot:TRINITY_DN0_c6150_g1_i1.p1 TRINITY_DN0_c6150_g1~~TRINITY_DN0_c6150_g1_i1.p1  ORF type:complete len:145 (-),score=15.10 TRINITY_DN0_c6150_g1_i1:27-461(-)
MCIRDRSIIHLASNAEPGPQEDVLRGEMKRIENRLVERIKALEVSNREVEQRIKDLIPREMIRSEPIQRNSGQFNFGREIRTNNESMFERSIPDDTYVIITGTGKRYHLSSECQGLVNSSSFKRTTKSFAKSQNLSLCGYCATN